tara:strand:+ start:4332 stop:4574 length:243 start_codon:yes stop_codon:yes gene_type:complete
VPHIKIELQSKKQIVLFNYLYSLYQHLGWLRASKYKKSEIIIYTTKDLLKENIKILNIISKDICFKISEYSTSQKKIIPD